MREVEIDERFGVEETKRGEPACPEEKGVGWYIITAL
jgi:hypothetical protein